MSKKKENFIQKKVNELVTPFFKKNKKRLSIDETIDNLFAELEPKQNKFPWFLTILSGISIVIVIFLLFLFLKYDYTSVNSESMATTLPKNQQVLYQDNLPIHRFNIVLVEKDGKEDILRVIGMPGDSLSMTDDVLKVNQTEYDEVYLKRNYVTFKSEEKNDNQNYTSNFDLANITNSDVENQHIPRDKYVLLGDNRQEASDSRKVGYYDEKDIKGTVLLRLWPLSEFGPIE